MNKNDKEYTFKKEERCKKVKPKEERKSFKESYSPSVGRVTIDDWLSNDK